MFPDFTEIFKPHVEALKPHLDTAQGALADIRNLLVSIEENTRDKPFTPDRDRLWLPFQCTAAFAGGTPVLVATVPPTEDWEIENLRGAASSAGTPIIKLYDSPNKGAASPSDAALLTVQVGDVSTSIVGSVNGNGVVVPGGTGIYAVAVAATNVANGVLQVRRRRRTPARPGFGGDMLPGPSGDAEEPKAEPNRHVRTWTT